MCVAWRHATGLLFGTILVDGAKTDKVLNCLKCKSLSIMFIELLHNYSYKNIAYVQIVKQNKTWRLRIVTVSIISLFVMLCYVRNFKENHNNRFSIAYDPLAAVKVALPMFFCGGVLSLPMFLGGTTVAWWNQGVYVWKCRLKDWLLIEDNFVLGALKDDIIMDDHTQEVLSVTITSKCTQALIFRHAHTFLLFPKRLLFI